MARLLPLGLKLTLCPIEELRSRPVFLRNMPSRIQNATLPFPTEANSGPSGLKLRLSTAFDGKLLIKVPFLCQSLIVSLLAEAIIFP
jgi:hypothetical protein